MAKIILPNILEASDGTFYVVDEAFIQCPVMRSGFTMRDEARAYVREVMGLPAEDPEKPAAEAGTPRRVPLQWLQDEERQSSWHCQPTTRLRARISWSTDYEAWHADAAYLRTPDQWIGESPRHWQTHTELEVAQLWVEMTFRDMERRMTEDDRIMGQSRKSFAPVQRKRKTSKQGHK